MFRYMRPNEKANRYFLFLLSTVWWAILLNVLVFALNMGFVYLIIEFLAFCFGTFLLLNGEGPLNFALALLGLFVVPYATILLPGTVLVMVVQQLRRSRENFIRSFFKSYGRGLCLMMLVSICLFVLLFITGAYSA